MITISNLEKKYGGRKVVDIADLRIPDGEILGLVGNNGAGKTTLLRLMLDLIKSEQGTIENGSVIIGKSENWKSFTSSYLDEGFLFDFLTPEEFFYLIGNMYGLTGNAVDAKLQDFSPFFNDEILGKGRKLIRDFSKGNKQKIGLTSALIVDPTVLVLDEPFDGLDPTSQLWLKKKLTGYRKTTRATIVLSSHDLGHVTAIADRIVLIERGRITREMVNNETALKELEE
jgi:ABC-2 type transport system ATP-binding protein